MAATDGQIVVAAARWAEEATYLREFVSKYRLPAVIKITKGQYGGLGVPTLPAPSLQSTALLVSAGRRRKIVAQAVKIKEGRRVVGVGPRLAIPDSYAGYFEILSEEGRAVRGIESVSELCRRCPEEGALVRETVRGIACRVDDDTGIVVPEGTRTLAAGETIVTAGEVSLPGRGRFLRCVDCRGDSVLLGMEQRGRFSALAREDNISGVHTARALLSKRLPLTVRLVHGQPPRGLKSSSQFVPELRLLSTFEEEHVFALPLQREGAAVALPLAAPLKLVKARNEEALRSMQEFTRLVDRASRLVADVADRAHVLDGRLGESKPSRQTRSGTGFLRRSSTNSDNGPNLNHHRNNAGHHHHHHHYHSNGHQASSGPGHAGYRDENRVPPSACTEEYDEIDQIYDYVRGFAPLPKSVRSPYESPLPANQGPSPPLTPVTVTVAPLLDDRPEPPPIETIPTKKIQAEKRTRRAVKEAPQPRAEKPPLAKLYVKNSGTQRGRPLMRQKSASPLKEMPPGYKGGSPLFNIRYKSLTNLQQAMELDGTLDSSHSGGRTSGDSGAGAKLPEKRSRRLSRPRSLTNLVWELRGGSGLGCTRPETPPPATAAPLPPTKCGPRLAVTVVAPRRVGTLYL
ncbi:CABIT domain-containing protein serrano [Megalopta genalis]|uniref:CABIT domain-containing protein serrano n=1 Tax=Megalopta genalis TaxID=115081 RepID=UPI003FCFC32B